MEQPLGQPRIVQQFGQAMPPATEVRGSGFRITAFPSARAGATERIDKMAGKLKGLMTPMIP